MSSMAFSCGESTGVCTACCLSFSGDTVCYDDWTQADCDEFNAQEVNGLEWFFHENQTCSGRGTP